MPSGTVSKTVPYRCQRAASRSAGLQACQRPPGSPKGLRYFLPCNALSELHDEPELIHPPDEDGRGLQVRRRQGVAVADGVDRRHVQQVEEIQLRLDARATEPDHLRDAEIELVDAVAV